MIAAPPVGFHMSLARGRVVNPTLPQEFVVVCSLAFVHLCAPEVALLLRDPSSIEESSHLVGVS